MNSLSNSLSASKGQTFALGLWIFFTTSMITLFIILGTNFEVESSGVNIQPGKYSWAYFDSVQEGEKLKLFIEQAGKIAAIKAPGSYAASGQQFQEYVGGGAGDGHLEESECGRYVYNKWSTKEEFCNPGTGDDFNKFLKEEFKTLVNNYPKDLGFYGFNLTQVNGSVQVEANGDSELTVDIILPEKFSIDRYSFGDNEAEFAGELAWPTTGKEISSCYGERQLTGKNGVGTRWDFHDGIDVAVPEGQPVFAALGGEVVYTCEGECSGFGGTIVIKHGDQFYTRYSHLNKVLRTQGQTVDAGQQIGRSGNTGNSEGPHLDFKIYDSDKYDASYYGRGEEPGKNPLCFYPQEFRDTLEASGNADSCAVKYGDPAEFDGRVQDFKRDCSRIAMNNLNQQLSQLAMNNDNQATVSVTYQGGQDVKVGEYSVQPGFQLLRNTTAIPQSPNSVYSKVVEWANQTWQSCTDSPATCFEAAVDAHNDNDDKKFEIRRACEDNLLYRAITQRFTECLNNDRYDCTCQLNLTQVYDYNDYRIGFDSEGIKLFGSERQVFTPNSGTGYYSVVPGDPQGETSIFLEQQIAGGNRVITLQEKGQPESYPVIKWYKPSKDKMVLVEEGGDKPACHETQDTFLVCAEADEKFPVQKGDATVMDELKVKFALQLRDKLPESPEDEDVELTPVEHCNEDIADKVRDEAIKQAIGMVIGAPLAGLIMDVAPDDCDSSVSVAMELPEGEDISGFEVHCQLNTPLGEVDVSNAQGVVTVNNPYVENKSGSYSAAQNALGLEEEALLREAGADNAMDAACEYVKMADDDGRMRMVREIKSIQSGSLASFNLASCGSDALKQLAGGFAEYCYKFVPVDSRGVRNPDAAVTKCVRLESLQDRVLELLGLQDVASPYISVIDDATEAADAIQSGNYGELWEMTGAPGSELMQKVTDSELYQMYQDNIATGAVQDIAGSIQQGDYYGALGEFVEGLPEEDKVELVTRMIQTRELPPEATDYIMKQAGEEMPLGEKQELLQEAAANIDDLDDYSRNKIREYATGKAVELTADKKESVITAVRENSDNLRRSIEETAEDNLDTIGREDAEADTGPTTFVVAWFQAPTLQDLNDLGLTREQTDQFMRRILTGHYGDAARREATRLVMGELGETELDEAYDLLSEAISRNPESIARELFEEQTEQLTNDAKARIIEEVPEAQIPDEAKQIMMQGLPRNAKTQLFNHFRQRFQSEMDEALQRRLDSIWNPPACADDLLGNYQIQGLS